MVPPVEDNGWQDIGSACKTVKVQSKRRSGLSKSNPKARIYCQAWVHYLGTIIGTIIQRFGLHNIHKILLDTNFTPEGFSFLTPIIAGRLAITEVEGWCHDSGFDAISLENVVSAGGN